MPVPTAGWTHQSLWFYGIRGHEEVALGVLNDVATRRSRMELVVLIRQFLISPWQYIDAPPCTLR